MNQTRSAAFSLYWLLSSVLLSISILDSSLARGEIPLFLSQSTQPQAQSIDARQTEADRLFGEAEQHRLRYQLTDAQVVFQRVLKLRQALADEVGVAAVLNQLGEVDFNLRQFDQAQARLQQALVIWRQRNDRAGEAEALTYLGVLSRLRSNYPQAQQHLQTALTLQQQRQDAIGMAKVWLELGMLSIEQGNSTQAFQQFQQGLAILQTAENKPEIAVQRRMQQGRLLSFLGFAQFNLQQLETALDSMQQALALNRETGDRGAEADTLFLLGIVYSRQQQFDKALEAGKQALEIAQLSGALPFVGYLHNFLGMTFYRQKQYPQAIAAFQQALAVHQKTNDLKDLAEVWSNLGGVYEAQKQYSQAVEALKQGVTSYQTLGKLREQAQGWNNLGRVYNAQSQYSQAIVAFQQARTLYQKLQDREAEKSVTLSLGLAQVLQGQIVGQQGGKLLQAGDYQEALNVHQQTLLQLQQAELIARTLNNPQFSGLVAATFWNSYLDQAQAFDQLNRNTEAIAAAQKALSFAREHRDNLPKTMNPFLAELVPMLRMASYYEKLEQFDQAIETYHQALELNRRVSKDPVWEVRNLESLANLYNGLSQYSQALKTAQQALEIVRQRLKDSREETSLLATLGNVHLALGNYDAAIQHYEQGLEIAQKTGAKSLEMTFLNNLGNAYEGQGQYRKASEYLEQVLTRSEDALRRIETGDEQAIEQFCVQIDPAVVQRSLLRPEDCPNLARTLRFGAVNNLGSNYESRGRYTEALNLHQQGLELARKLQNRDREATSLNNLGLVYTHLGLYSKALEHFQQALEIQMRIGDRSGQATTLNNISGVYREQGLYDQALKTRQQSLEIVRKIGSRGQEVTLLGGIGTIYTSQGDYEKSLEFYQEALSLASTLGIETSTQLSNLGFAYDNLGNPVKAVEYYQQALAIAQKTGSRPNEATILGNLSDLDWSQGKYAKALQQQQRVLVIHQETGDRSSEAIALFRLGSTYSLLGQYDRAIEFLQKALVMSRELGSRSYEAHVLSRMAIVYREQQQYAKALENHQQALKIRRSIGEIHGTSIALSSIGTVQVRQGQFDQAVESFQEALKIQKAIGVRSDQAVTLRGLGLAYAGQGRISQAIETLQQAVTIHRAVQDRSQEGVTLSELGSVLLRNQQLAAAETALLNAVDIFDSLRSGLNDQENISLFDTQTKTYRLLQQVLIAQNKPEVALEAAERGRARAFVELLYRQLRSSATLDSEPDRAMTAIQPPNVAQIQKIAREQQATLVEYSIIDEETLYIWVVQPTGQIVFRSVNLSVLNPAPTKPTSQVASRPTRSSLTEPIEGLRATLRGGRTVSRQAPTSQTGNRLTFNAHPLETKHQLRQLHQALIQPIADLLPTDPEQRVIFIPQDSLFLVPFAALLDTDNRSLIERHTIVIAPAIQVLQLTREQRQRLTARNNLPKRSPGTLSANASPLIVGNPTMPKVADEELAPLPGSEAEAKAIAQFFKANVLTGNQATKAAVLQRIQTASLVHLATHGLLDDFKGLGIPGAIALAPTTQDNGLLTADEILNLQLQADLVVLSACDTGRGRVTGDGVIGLSRSLISAGTPSVIVSLWAVSDTATADLMMTFYQALQKSSNKAQALRQAMLATKEKYPYVIDWAGFTLIGEP